MRFVCETLPSIVKTINARRDVDRRIYLVENKKIQKRGKKVCHFTSKLFSLAIWSEP